MKKNSFIVGVILGMALTGIACVSNVEAHYLRIIELKNKQLDKYQLLIEYAQDHEAEAHDCADAPWLDGMETTIIEQLEDSINMEYDNI